jgi:hypothetical protein
MKNLNFLKTSIALVTLLSLGTSTAALAGGEACEDSCKMFKDAMGGFPTPGSPPDAMGAKFLISYCHLPSTVETTLSDQIKTGKVPFNSKTGDDAWNSCFQALQNSWIVIGNHCAAIDLISNAQTAGRVGATAYTAAAIACVSACAAENGVVTAPFAKGACLGVGIGATIVDIGAVLAESKAADGILSQLGMGSAVLGDIAAMTAAGASADMVKTKIVSSCGAGFFMTSAAVLKWKDVNNMAGNKDTECESVTAMDSTAAMVAAAAYAAGVASGAGNAPNTLATTGSTGSTGGQVGKGGSMTHGGGGAYIPMDAGMMAGLDSPKFAAAVSGPYGELFKALPREKLKDIMEKVGGITMDELNKKLATQSPATAIASAPGVSAAMAGALKEAEKAALDGKFALKGDLGGSSSSYASGGGGGAGGKGGAAKPAFGGLFGGGAVGGSGTSSEATFEKMKRAPTSLENGDIWHEGFGGSIFQIVSNKLSKERTRVDELEWETPLNRALAGLPTKKGKK